MLIIVERRIQAVDARTSTTEAFWERPFISWEKIIFFCVIFFFGWCNYMEIISKISEFSLSFSYFCNSDYFESFVCTCSLSEAANKHHREREDQRKSTPDPQSPKRRQNNPPFSTVSAG